MTDVTGQPSQVYAGVAAALADRGLGDQQNPSRTLRWFSVQGALWLAPSDEPGAPPTPLLEGRGVSGTAAGHVRGIGPTGLFALGVVLQRLDEQPPHGVDYCSLVIGAPEMMMDAADADGLNLEDRCAQRDVDAGTLFVSETYDGWGMRYVKIGLVREDQTAVSVSASIRESDEDVDLDVLVDLAQDPRLRS